MTYDPKRARLETILRENGLRLAGASAAIGRNRAYLQQYLRRGTPEVLSFQDTETLGRMLACDPSELRHKLRSPHAPRKRTRRYPPGQHALVRIPEIAIYAR